MATIQIRYVRTDGTIAKSTITDAAGALVSDGVGGLTIQAVLTDPQYPIIGATGTTAVAGNDSRLTDSRTPAAHATSHQDGGSDEISVLGLSGLLADAQTPLAHTQAASTISDSTAAGRALLTAADAAAQRTALSLGNVDNTSDASKPVSTATQTALDLKQPLDADLTTIASLTPTTDNFMVATASAWASRTPTQARSQLGLGTAAVAATGDFAPAAQGTDARTPTFARPFALMGA